MSEPSDQASHGRTLVLGLGNVLMGDDAFGPYVVRTLDARWSCSPDVELLDGGTPGMDLLHRLGDCRSLVVIDTVLSDGLPGALRTYRRDEFLARPVGPRLSPHDPNLKEALLTAQFAGGGPDEMLLVGVVPERVDTGIGLSAAVRHAVPQAIDLAVAELRRLGHAVEARDPVRAADIFWEAEAVLI